MRTARDEDALEISVTPLEPLKLLRKSCVGYIKNIFDGYKT